MPRLTLIRHAKAAWPAGVDDLQRPLAERGIADCSAGKHFLQVFNFDLVLVSTALRTQMTCDLLELRTTERKNVSDIYEASLGTLLDVINQQEVENLALIGHSPGMPLLAWFLANNHESLPAQKLRLKFPTLGIAQLESAQAFPNWGEGSSRLTVFEIPRANPESFDLD